MHRGKRFWMQKIQWKELGYWLLDFYYAPPNAGFWKFNVYGYALSKPGSSGCGGVLRDSNWICS
ncbi:hypothetical protein REPUB_Repub08aG0202200 [Reevesia pubescens]